MGAWGALIMGFFGALTLAWEVRVGGPALALPFVGFAVIALAAAQVIRMPGQGLTPSPRVERAITWSSTAEGVGLFLAVTIVTNLHRPEWRLPAMALVVGLHFLPIAAAAAFRPFWVLGGALIACALAGFVAGGTIAGVAAALSLWVASALAVVRDGRAKRAGAPSASSPRP